MKHIAREYKADFLVPDSVLLAKHNALYHKTTDRYYQALNRMFRTMGRDPTTVVKVHWCSWSV